jgi:hypothetical protein
MRCSLWQGFDEEMEQEEKSSRTTMRLKASLQISSAGEFLFPKCCLLCHRIVVRADHSFVLKSRAKPL